MTDPIARALSVFSACCFVLVLAIGFVIYVKIDLILIHERTQTKYHQMEIEILQEIRKQQLDEMNSPKNLTPCVPLEKTETVHF